MQLTLTDIETLMRLGGWAILRFRHHDYGLGMRVGGWDYDQDPNTAYGYTPAHTALQAPSAAELSLMDTTTAWLAYVPHSGRRRAVALRSLYDGDRDRCVVPLAYVATELGVPVPMVRRWYGQGVREIARAVNRSPRTVMRMEPCLRWAA